MKKWGKRILIGFAILLVAIIGFMHIAMNYLHYSDKEIEHLLGKGKVQVSNLIINDKAIRVISEVKSPEDSLLIVFVHGAPGSWDAFKDYMLAPQIKNLGRLITYDRPGYNNDEAVVGIVDQTDFLMEIIRQHQLPQVAIIGHSYGATITAYAAAAFPDIINKSISIAPLLDPESEPMFWFSYLAHWKITKWLAPEPFKIAGEEKFAHAQELRDVEHQWKNLSVPLFHIHGMTDILAPAKENLDYSKLRFPEDCLEQLAIPEKGHLFLWTDVEFVATTIVSFLQNY